MSLNYAHEPISEEDYLQGELLAEPSMNILMVKSMRWLAPAKIIIYCQSI